MEATGLIAKLRGMVEPAADGSCVVEVGGVGYLVFCSARTLAELPPGGTATLLIETQVREDAISLYGFAGGAERDWFRLLTTVQGVGAKVALGLLSALSPDQLIAAITTGDKAALTRSPGVGPKLGIRIITELQNRAGTMPGGAALPVAFAPKGTAADALSALTNLGYRRAEAEAALAAAAAAHGADAGLDTLIRAGLKALAK